MSQIQQCNHNELMPHDGMICPGTWVSYVTDQKSWGMVVASAGDQATVLWSKAPKFVPAPGNFAAPPPVPKSRRVTAHDVDRASEMFSMGMISKSYIRQLFDLEETYEAMDWTRLDPKDDHHADVLFHANGDVTVKRTVDQLPPDIDPKDVHVRRSRW